ncbi:g10936 [Coccomyxa elongata]
MARKRKHSPARVPPQTEEQLCRAVKRLHAFSETELPLLGLKEEGGSVGLECEEVAHPDGYASAAVSLCDADDNGKAPAGNDLGAFSPAVSPAASSWPAYDCGTSGDAQVSAVHPDQEGSATDAGTSSKERQTDTNFQAIKREPSARPQQADKGADQVVDTLGAAESGPSSLTSAISQLPDRLRHIRFSGRDETAGKERRGSLDSVEEPITPGRTEKAGAGNATLLPDSQEEQGPLSNFESLYEEANRLLKNLHFQRLMRHAPASPDRTDERKEVSHQKD